MADPREGQNLWGRIMTPLVVVVGIGVLVAADLATDRERTTSGQSDFWFDLLNLVTRSHPIASQTAFVTAWVLIGVFVALILVGSQFAFTKTPEKHVPWREREGGAGSGERSAAPDAPVYGTPPSSAPATPSPSPYARPSVDQPVDAAPPSAPSGPQAYGTPPAPVTPSPYARPSVNQPVDATPPSAPSGPQANGTPSPTDAPVHGTPPYGAPPYGITPSGHPAAHPPTDRP